MNDLLSVAKALLLDNELALYGETLENVEAVLLDVGCDATGDPLYVEIADFEALRGLTAHYADEGVEILFALSGDAIFSFVGTILESHPYGTTLLAEALLVAAELLAEGGLHG